MRATIFVETESQKQIVVGKGGSIVKKIGTRARPGDRAAARPPGLPRAEGQGEADAGAGTRRCSSGWAFDAAARPLRRRRHAVPHARPALRPALRETLERALRRRAARGRARAGRPRGPDLAADRAARPPRRRPRRRRRRRGSGLVRGVRRRATSSSCATPTRAAGARLPARRKPSSACEAAGHRLALLTGNPEPVARARMERLGLDALLPGRAGRVRLRARIAGRADRRSRASPRRRLAGRRDRRGRRHRARRRAARATGTGRSPSAPRAPTTASGRGRRLPTASRGGRNSWPGPGRGGPGLHSAPWRRRPRFPTGFELPLEPRLPRIGSIDQVALEERAATLAKRSIKTRGEGLRARARGADDRPDDARGLRHAGQGRGARLEGDPPRPVRRERAVGRRALRLPEPRPDRRRAPARQRRQGRLGRDRVPVGPVAARDQARRGALGGRARRRRGRHGDRPRRLPRRPLREGLRRDRAREGGLAARRT